MPLPRTLIDEIKRWYTQWHQSSGHAYPHDAGVPGVGGDEPLLVWEASTSGDLTAERILAAGSGITLSNDGTSLTIASSAGVDLSAIDFLVGTASGLLSAEIPVGTTPGGELGGTWASPTVDATHSGSAHHAVVTLGTDADVLLGLTGQQIDLDSQNANLMFAGPASGGAADPTFRSMVMADIPAAQKVATINFIVSGGGSAITTGVKGYVVVDFACTISNWTAVCEAAPTATNLVVDIKKSTYAGFAGSLASITGTDLPTITTTNVKGQSTALTGWTTSIAAGDILEFSVSTAPGTTTLATISLKVTRT